MCYARASLLWIFKPNTVRFSSERIFSISELLYFNTLFLQRYEHAKSEVLVKRTSTRRPGRISKLHLWKLLVNRRQSLDRFRRLVSGLVGRLASTQVSAPHLCRRELISTNACQIELCRVLRGRHSNSVSILARMHSANFDGHQDHGRFDKKFDW